MTKATIIVGDCRSVLRTLAAESVQCVVTSPPYWGLRDYGTAAQIGLEQTPEEYVAEMVSVFAQIKRVLRADGTVWLNLGDTFAARAAGAAKPKDLVGVPWLVALALQRAGWWLRSDVIWSKPNPMPDPTTDRPTRAHEYIFLLSKSSTYFYDADAIREPHCEEVQAQLDKIESDPELKEAVRAARRKGNIASAPDRGDSGKTLKIGNSAFSNPLGRNKRSVWNVPTFAYSGAHFATFPPELIEPCIKAGSPQGGMVLDPFCGTATVGAVATGQGREFIGIEINPEYAKLGQERIGLFATIRGAA